MSVARPCRKSYTILGLILITNNVSHPSPAGATESFDGGFGFVGRPEIENPAQRLRKKKTFYMKMWTDNLQQRTLDIWMLIGAFMA